jgi:hypothetical protein
LPYVPVANVVQAELVFSWDSQVVENVLHFQTSVPPNLVTMNELGAWLVSWWSTNVKPHVPATVSFINVKMTDLTVAFGPVVDYATSLPMVGTNASPSMPNNCALVITKRTALRGRSYRGRIYHVGLTEGNTVANQYNSGSVAALVTAYNLLRNVTLASATAFEVVVSRIQAGVPLAAGVSTTVTTHTCDGILDSQRRRLPGRGS